MTNQLKEKVKLNIDPRDISIAHRIGGKPQQGPDKRKSILIQTMQKRPEI